MNVLGFSFILYFLKLPYSSQLYNNRRNDNINLYRKGTLGERLAKTLRRHELDLMFLVTARAAGVYPKFTNLTNVKSNNKKYKSDSIVAFYSMKSTINIDVLNSEEKI